MILFDNFKEVFSRKSSLLIGVMTFMLITLLFQYMTDDALISGNLGVTYYYVNEMLQILVAVLFAFFVPISWYKISEFSAYSVTENSTGIFGTFIGVLAAGCPACSVTVASYIGLAGIISFLPWHGLELKLVSVPLLMYANYSLLKDLHVCRITRKRK